MLTRRRFLESTGALLLVPTSLFRGRKIQADPKGAESDQVPVYQEGIYGVPLFIPPGEIRSFEVPVSKIQVWEGHISIVFRIQESVLERPEISFHDWREILREGAYDIVHWFEIKDGDVVICCCFKSAGSPACNWNTFCAKGEPFYNDIGMPCVQITANQPLWGVGGCVPVADGSRFFGDDFENGQDPMWKGYLLWDPERVREI